MVDLASVAYLSPPGDDAADWPGVPRLENGWYPTGGPVDPASDGGIANWQALELARRSDTLKARVDLLSRRVAAEVTVGPGGEYSTINAALAELSDQRLAYVPGGVMTRLRLRPGFVMREQVLVDGVNLGWIEIVADDAEVLIDRAYLTTFFGTCYPVFGATAGGVTPRISTLFTMMATGSAADRVGVAIYAGGGASVSSGAGVKSAGSQGIRVEHSGEIAANGAIFSSAGGHGAYLAGGVSGSLHGAVLTAAGDRGIFATHGARVNAVQADCTGGLNGGIQATRGATISATGALCRIGASDASSDIAVGQGGIIAASSAIGGTSITPNTITAAGIIFR